MTTTLLEIEPGADWPGARATVRRAARPPESGGSRAGGGDGLRLALFTAFHIES